MQLPREVISLLKIPDVPEYQLPTTSSAIANENFSDFEWEAEDLSHFNIELEVDETWDNFEVRVIYNILTFIKFNVLFLVELNLDGIGSTN